MDIGGIIDSGTSIAGLISGAIIQDETQAELKKLAKERPDYEIPSSIQAQLELLRQRANQGLPGEELMAGQIQQGTAQGVAASREVATSAADLLGATTSLYGQQTQNMTDLQIASARAQAQNELAYAQGLGTYGEYQDKAFNWNQALPWQTEMNRVQGISQAAYDLQMGGLGGVSTAGSDMFGGMTIGGDSGGATGGGNNYSGYAVDPNLGYQGSTPLTTNQSLGQYQYNPTGQQTLGQYQYNPSGQQTLGQYIY